MRGDPLTQGESFKMKKQCDHLHCKNKAAYKDGEFFVCRQHYPIKFSQVGEFY